MDLIFGDRRILYFLAMALILIILPIWLINSIDVKVNAITNFSQCQAAGYPIKESHPRQCTVPNGKTFVEDLQQNMMPVSPEESPVPNASASVSSCKDNCGNNICEQIVCAAIGCPCAESPQTCAADCK